MTRRGFFAAITLPSDHAQHSGAAQNDMRGMWLYFLDAQAGQLLVLGAPGAGKTTMLIELAHTLVMRAQTDQTLRIPIVVNLASWKPGRALRNWLAEALRDVLGASKHFSSKLAASDELVLLLDGLDEVAEPNRPGCIVAISSYLREADLPPPLVVACRSREYEAIGTKLPIGGAVELKPLELAEVEHALANVPAAQGVLAALKVDDQLRTLSTTPLAINIMLLSYAGRAVPITSELSFEARQAKLWEEYVRRMLQQRPIKKFGDTEQILRKLHWFSSLLSYKNQTDFLLDDIQPEDIKIRHKRNAYRYSLSIICGFLTGFMVLACLISIWSITALFRNTTISSALEALEISITYGLVGGFSGILTGLFANIFKNATLSIFLSTLFGFIANQLIAMIANNITIITMGAYIIGENFDTLRAVISFSGAISGYITGKLFPREKI